jgi:hypothetical protein
MQLKITAAKTTQEEVKLQMARMEELRSLDHKYHNRQVGVETLER